jgi:molybdopterin-guanine dinucleotide biosynthesis protein A
MVNLRPPIFGLVLTGGKSTRMKKDKASLKFHNKPQVICAYELLLPLCEEVFISKRKGQKRSVIQSKLPHIYDLKKFSGRGPLSGILSAMAKFPKAAWLILACDLPFVDDKTLRHLLRYRDSTKIATAYKSRFNDLPEPLCAIYEPKAQRRLLTFFAKGITCPRKILINSKPRLLKLKNKNALDNINTPEEYQKAVSFLKP